MNLIRTDKTYATFANAEKALAQTLAKAGTTLAEVRYIIATTADGKRFAPALVGAQYIPFIHVGITVLG
jgi:hypothetical protein